MADLRQMHNDWLAQMLDQRGQRSGAELARFVGVSEHSISRARHGKRRIKSHELELMKQFFRAAPPTMVIATAHVLGPEETHSLEGQASLDVFHKMLENLDQTEHDFVLQCCTALAAKFGEWKLVRRRG